MTRLTLDEAHSLCRAACLRAGASEAAADALARASVEAEAMGQPSVGLAHLVDHLEALRAGRIDGAATPAITRPAPAMILSDAGAGTAQLGFDLAVEDLCAAAQSFGIALFAQNNAYTSGCLGLYAHRLAERGLVALAATSGPALMAGSGGTRPVYCTNPLAFAAPRAGRPPLLIDQSSSATASTSATQRVRGGRSRKAGRSTRTASRPPSLERR